MSAHHESSEWEFLIGYPLEQAAEILKEESAAYEVIWTSAPKKQTVTSSQDPGEDAYVIAVRSGSPLGLVCAVQDWHVE
ncbi:MAG: hypothetical protein ACOX46_05805 [Limnochordia bacterium]|nr:hypothetical protein [Bacillota bacterium]